MKQKKVTVAAVILIAAVVVIAALIFSRAWISKQVFMRSSASLVEKLSPDLQKKYATDLRYTLETFWRCHDRGLVPREDLNDVMDKMGELRGKSSVTDREIFDFIGYVSRLYTEAINRHQRDAFPE